MSVSNKNGVADEHQDSAAVADRINQELYKKNLELAMKNKVFALLHELYDITTRTLQVEDTARKMVYSIRQKLNFDLVSVFQYDKVQKIFSPIALTTSERLQAHFRKVEDDFSNFSIEENNEENLIAECFRKNQMIETDDFGSVFSEHFSNDVVKEICVTGGIRSTLAYPLQLEDKKIGVLLLSLNRHFHELTAFEKEALNNLVDVITISLDKSVVYDDLREANDKLKQLDKAKSEFMSIASHQLRTPLSGIAGYLSMIMDGDYGETAPEQKPVIKDILNASQRLSRIVNVFLNVTRIEAGRFVMNFTTAPFDTVIEDIYKELKPTADKKDVELTLKKSKLPEVEADIDKIKDVILNLVDNAIKYTPEGSVTITSEANKRTVHVMVQDTGVGIAPEEAKNLFSKFVRGSGIAQVQPDGSGLGLYIAKRVVEGHSGKIWVESEGEGKGSTFHFEIPIKADKDAMAKTKEFQDRAKAK